MLGDYFPFGEAYFQVRTLSFAEGIHLTKSSVLCDVWNSTNQAQARKRSIKGRKCYTVSFFLWLSNHHVLQKNASSKFLLFIFESSSSGSVGFCIIEPNGNACIHGPPTKTFITRYKKYPPSATVGEKHTSFYIPSWELNYITSPRSRFPAPTCENGFSELPGPCTWQQ